MKMKKSQIKVFEELLQDENFRGKKALRHLLWLNTAEQKFKVGDCFVVTDRGHSVYGYPVKDFKAKIVEVYSFNTGNEWYYKLEADVRCGCAGMMVDIRKAESELVRAEKCDDNKNVLGGG
jgi:hypothetical protein